MALDEKTRLDLRGKFEELLGERLADAAMEAMPNLDYEQLATKDDILATKADIESVRTELRGEIAELRGEVAEFRGEIRGEMAEVRGEIAELRGEMAELRGDIRGEMAANLRIMVVTQLGTALALAGFVAGLS